MLVHLSTMLRDAVAALPDDAVPRRDRVGNGMPTRFVHINVAPAAPTCVPAWVCTSLESVHMSGGVCRAGKVCTVTAETRHQIESGLLV
jgi:hypothetical protein